MAECFFCGSHFTDKDNNSPIHIDVYDIDICSRCVEVRELDWKRMMRSIERGRDDVPTQPGIVQPGTMKPSEPVYPAPVVE